MRMKFRILAGIILFIHFCLAIARFLSHGVVRHQLARLQVVTLTSTVMLLTSVYMWRRISFAVKTLFPNENEVGNRRLRILCLQDIAQAMMCLFLFLSHIALFFYYILLGPEPNFFAVVSLSFIAAYAHILLFLFIADILLFASRIVHEKVTQNSVHTYLQENRSYHIFLAVILGFMFMFGGLYATHSDPVVRNSSIPMKTFAGVDGSNVSLVLLSDIHIGPTVGKTRISRIVELTNALKPDIIAIAGDLADGLVRDYQGAASPLCDLSAPGGVYFATGNHEYMHGNVTEWFWFLENCNIKILHNQNEKVTINGRKFCIAGADDIFAIKAHIPGHGMDLKKALNGCEPDSTNILLAHQPNAAKIVLDDPELNKKVNLILSGHTHAGQMYPFVPIVYLANAFVRGLYYDAQSDTYVYVSAGVNFFGPPIKMFRSCEIININMYAS